MFHLSESPNRRRAAFKTPPFPGQRRSLKNGRRPSQVDRIRPPGARHRLKRVVEVASAPRDEERVGTPEVERRDGGIGDAETLSSRAGSGGFDGDGEENEP